MSQNCKSIFCKNRLFEKVEKKRYKNRKKCNMKGLQNQIEGLFEGLMMVLMSNITLFFCVCFFANQDNCNDCGNRNNTHGTQNEGKSKGR